MKEDSIKNEKEIMERLEEAIKCCPDNPYPAQKKAEMIKRSTNRKKDYTIIY
jgi:hypothetical protein